METVTGALLTIQQVQDTLQCSRRKIYQLAKANRLEMVKFDGATRVTERSLNDLLRSIAAKPWQAGGANGST